MIKPGLTEKSLSAGEWELTIPTSEARRQFSVRDRDVLMKSVIIYDPLLSLLCWLEFVTVLACWTGGYRRVCKTIGKADLQ